MIKKEYMKPEVLVVKLQHQTHILIGSVTGLEATGLGDDIPILPPGAGPGIPGTDIGGILWNDAW
ncbi:MAG: hypothetical protein IK144_07290 [Bacteroidaceae bacterium]|nr:hypothetical protein [Bacteroidaceae bacterium]